MRRLITSLLTAIFITSGITSSMYAQEYTSTPVTVSKEKVKINGQVCYSHIVLEKQTLFSICKAYNVTTEELYRYNPALKEKGLQKNSILIIPIIEPEVNEEPAVIESSQTIEKPEAAADELKETDSDKKLTKIGETPQRIHVVKWYEDLDVISKKYGVSVEAVMSANGLKGRKLSKRQKLVIPSQGEMTIVQKQDERDTETPADTSQVTDSTSDKKSGILR